MQLLRMFRELIFGTGERAHRTPGTFTPQQLAELYQGLSADEQSRLSELARIAASDGSTTVDASPLRKRQNLSRSAIGRLLFEVDGSDGTPRPMHATLVELWDRDFGMDDLLGRAETDRDGRFEIRYDPADAGVTDLPDLELRVFEVNHFYRNGKLQFTQKMIFAVDGRRNVDDEIYDFGDVRIPWWEYDPHAPSPRLLVVGNSTPPQSFSPGRALVMAKQLAPLEFTKRRHFAQCAVAPDSLTLDEVQNDYPPTLTMRLEQEQPGLTRSDEYFGDRILNGMSASILDRDPRNPDRFWLHYHWNSYRQDDIHAMPNVDIWFEPRDDGIVPTEIRLHFRRRGHPDENPPMEEPVSYTPADGEAWLQAKRVARVSAAISAELDVHLVTTHLNTEQYAISAYRNLRRSPIRQLLIPHMKEVVLINQEADNWLLGEQGFVTRTQALTAEALEQRVRQSIGTLDWKNWQPRRRICSNHTYARAAGLFWDLLTGYVDEFFEQHQDGIIEHWYEIHRFSRDLVEHSAPLYMCDYLRGVLLDDEGRLMESAHDWFEFNERMDLTVDRREVDGRIRAVSPITDSDLPTDEDLRNLKQVCRYAIYHATFFHAWPNSRQHDDCGEVVYNSLGLRYGDHGVMVPESDHSICPPPSEASEQLWFATALTKTCFGFIMANEERDIPPGLIRRLRQHSQEFAELGVDIYRIQSRTNI